MKTTKRLTLLLSLVTLIFAGCSKNEISETKKNSKPAPTGADLQQATQKLPVIAGWNSTLKPQVNLTPLKSGEVLQISGSYWDEGAFSVHGALAVTGCIPSDYDAFVVYWLYNFNTGQWKTVSQKEGHCMDEDNLNTFLTYYGNPTNTDIYVAAAAQVYIQDPSGNISLWNTFYSNVILLDWPF